ncbi:DUF2911 domain-containing protein [Neolewinella antarctica]|uniref:DUF2911 domain-containing protein n=1 Tax=Neolewinella antarctica TaxID=442734 RepID=A0ABX0X7B3_9BACT|nr:DUF2911 domain-containing protein [Neolewinella antarctica]NJC24898.1 hypothetical protein [Neolewinella antarctica]
MLKLTSLLAFCLVVLVSCQDTNTVVDTPATDVTVEQQTVAELNNTANVKGENFEVKTIDGEIKSPRKELTGTISEVPVTINYGSPSVNDRTIFGELVPYNKVWRTGANEATRITFAAPVLVGNEGTELAAGTYALFTMPASKDSWTVIFNKKADQWGAYDYDEKDDLVKIRGEAAETGTTAERMDFALDGNTVKLTWADLTVSFPVKSAAK